MKKFFLLIFLLFLTGCNNNLNVHSEINYQDNNYVSITYPVINDTVVNYINKKYDYFNKVKACCRENEFNISSSYEKTSKYESLTLDVFLKTSKMIEANKSVTSFVFLDDKVLSLKDFLQANELKLLKEKVKTSLNSNYKDNLLTTKLDSFISSLDTYTNFAFTNSSLIININPLLVTKKRTGPISLSYSLKEFNSKKTLVKTKTTKKIKSSKKSLDISKKSIAFTFDDGPSIYTEEILKLLKKYNGSATFFVIGNKVNLYKDIMIKMAKENHEIGNHSYNHQWMSRMSNSELLEQINKTQKVIKDTVGITPTRIRPTYGALTKRMQSLVDLEISLWTVDPKDWKYKSSDVIAKRILNKTSDLDVILLHDTHKRTVKALEIVLKKLAKENYQFVTLSELAEIKLLRNNNLS